MLKKQISKFGILSIIILALFVFNSCDFLSGDDGIPGPTIYLVDDNNTRVYSGGSIYIGDVAASGPTSLINNLYIVNESGTNLTLSSGTKVVMVIESVTDIDNGTVQVYTTPFSNLSLDQSALEGSLNAGDKSSALKYTLTAPGGNSFTIRRRYFIELSNNSEIYNFEFEVYGYFSSN